MFISRGEASQVVLVAKSPSAKEGDTRDALQSLRREKSPEVGKGNPLQYSCLKKSEDRGAW